jgi:HEAT repeats/Putative zinc-finger
MNCDSVSKLIPLYFYGELPPEEEDRLEEHLDQCTVCTGELQKQRMLAAALDRRQAEPPQFLLEDCRSDLMAAVQGGAPHVARPSKGPWTLFLEAMDSTFGSLVRLRLPAGAVALIAIGFFAARFVGTSPAPSSPASLASALPSDDVFSTVRSVRPDASGRVQITFDETRRREVSGRMDDQNIQRLLLAAAHEDNPAVRVESVDLLKDRAGDTTEVRDALLNAVAHDTNPGVRLKALEGLKPLAGDPDVRKTLSSVLMADENPAVRMQVVDLLVAHRDDTVVGMMQGLVQREDNRSVRLKLEKALKDMNASIGTF